MRTRGVFRRVAPWVIVALVGACAVPARGVAATSALRILVTNDDGVHAPGIDVLVVALKRLPNVDLTVVAPADDQSGTGDSTTYDQSTVTTERTRTRSGSPATAVKGTPADGVLWALGSGLGTRPDLVVSGINSAENLGTSIPGSGTVGAARTAARAGIPALAVSQGAADEPDYSTAAKFAIAWVKSHRDQLLANRGQPVPGIVRVDNLNVPTCAESKVRGLARVPAASDPAAAVDCTAPKRTPRDDVTAFSNGYATITPLPVTAVCTRFTAAPGPVPIVQDPALDEVSGVVASRAHPPVLWVHNDSGGKPAVYAITPDGASLGEYRVDGASVVDWEDIAVGPGPEPATSYLYVGDIGDNAVARDSVDVYRVAEPALVPDGTGGTLAGAERFTFHYPRRPVDAEALLVDPATGDLFVIDKVVNGTATVFRAPSTKLVDGADVTLGKVASLALAADSPDAPAGLPGSLVTGADVSPDGNTVLVRTYRHVLAFARPKGEDLAAAFGVDPCRAPETPERQGEAVAFTADGKGYVTISEGEHAAVNTFTAS